MAPRTKSIRTKEELHLDDILYSLHDDYVSGSSCNSITLATLVQRQTKQTTRNQWKRFYSGVLHAADESLGHATVELPYPQMKDILEFTPGDKARWNPQANFLMVIPLQQLDCSKSVDEKDKKKLRLKVPQQIHFAAKFDRLTDSYTVTKVSACKAMDAPLVTAAVGEKGKLGCDPDFVSRRISPPSMDIPHSMGPLCARDAEGVAIPAIFDKYSELCKKMEALTLLGFDLISPRKFKLAIPFLPEGSMTKVETHWNNGVCELYFTRPDIYKDCYPNYVSRVDSYEFVSDTIQELLDSKEKTAKKENDSRFLKDVTNIPAGCRKSCKFSARHYPEPGRGQ